MKEIKCRRLIELASVYFPSDWTLKQKLNWIYDCE